MKKLTSVFVLFLSLVMVGCVGGGGENGEKIPKPNMSAEGEILSDVEHIETRSDALAPDGNTVEIDQIESGRDYGNSN